MFSVEKSLIAGLLKEVDAARELKARVAKLEQMLEAFGVDKSKLQKSLGATAAEVLKSSAVKSTATNSWTPNGALSRLEKSATTRVVEPDESNTVKAAVHKALHGED